MALHSTAVKLSTRHRFVRPAGSSFGRLDLPAEAVGRLRQLAVLILVSAPILSVVRHLAHAAGAPVPAEAITGGDQLGLVQFALSALVLLFLRERKQARQWLFPLAIGYEAFLCLAAVVFERTFLALGEPPVRASFAVLPLLLFPLVVPMPMRRRIVATTLDVLMVPMGLVVATLHGAAFPQTEVFLVATLPVLLFGIISLFGARIVYGLTRQVEKARTLGSYELVEKLGAGGMGDVWRARHRMLVRPAAVKLIRSESLGADPTTAVARFEREAQATAVLRSPHTVEVYDFGRTDDGTFYYVMEMLDGLDLDKFVQRFGPVSAERTIYILQQVCRSLADAESHGLVHRDIKPANIILCRLGDEYDFVKVLDFGLVKARYDEEPADQKLSADNITIGTPAFMPPELALGKPVDTRCDLYAVGCVAYWLLTGAFVFRGETPLQTVMQHVNSPPVPPRERSEVEIPDELERIVLACLAKDPDDRPSSASELADLLAACAVDNGWGRSQATTWWRRHAPDLVGPEQHSGPTTRAD